MYTILSITIIIALAMACCFLYAKNSEAKTINKSLLGSTELSSITTEEAIKNMLAYQGQLESLAIASPMCYCVDCAKAFCTVKAIFRFDKVEREVILKRFYYADNMDYALSCAEELLDKLNEKI